MPNCMVQVSPAQRAFLDPPPTVLVIDDDPEILDSLEMVLEGAGFRVLTARNGWEGLNVFRKHRPTVVVSDIMMPEQDGIGAIVQMRRERSDVKIVAMSGGGYIDTWDYLPTAKRLGADATLRKARDVNKLIQIVCALAQ